MFKEKLDSPITWRQYLILCGVSAVLSVGIVAYQYYDLYGDEIKEKLGDIKRKILKK